MARDESLLWLIAEIWGLRFPALPENLEPLQAGITAIAEGRVDVAFFTTSTQVVHLLQAQHGDRARHLATAQDLDQRTLVRQTLGVDVLNRLQNLLKNSDGLSLWEPFVALVLQVQPEDEEHDREEEQVEERISLNQIIARTPSASLASKYSLATTGIRSTPMAPRTPRPVTAPGDRRTPTGLARGMSSRSLMGLSTWSSITALTGERNSRSANPTIRARFLGGVGNPPGRLPVG